MAFSKITTRGMSGDTLEAGDIAPNAIGASELADNAVDTAAIAATSITAAKLSSTALASVEHVKPHIQPGVLQPAVAGKLLDGTTNHSGAYGTAQSDGHSYYYTFFKGSKPIKDPRIGAHFGSQRYMFKSLQRLVDESGTHGIDVFSIDGREWIKTTGGINNNLNGVSVQFMTGGNDTIEVVGYFMDINLLSSVNDGTRTVQIQLDGVQKQAALGTGAIQNSPLHGRFVGSGSVINAGIGTTTLGIHTVRITRVAANSYFEGIELIVQDTSSTANKSKIQIPTQNVVSYGKKFTLSAAAQHYNPFDGMSGAKTLAQLGDYIDTATSLGMDNWKGGTANYYKPFNGGRVVKWVDSSGAIKTSVTMMPPNAQNYSATASNAVSNAEVQAGTNGETINFDTTTIANATPLSEVAKTFHYREFGNGSANGGTSGTYNDASMLNTSADIAYIMDDGLTGLQGDDVKISTEQPRNYFLGNTTDDAYCITFIGTGFSSWSDFSGCDNQWKTIAQNLPYGTHVLRVDRDADASPDIDIDGVALADVNIGTHGSFTECSFLQPKKPPIPADACILADYMLMADFVPSTGSGVETISKGTRAVSSSRDFYYTAASSGQTWPSVTNRNVHHSHGGWQINADNNESTATWKLRFFGTGLTVYGEGSTSTGATCDFKNGTTEWDSGATRFGVVTGTTGTDVNWVQSTNADANQKGGVYGEPLGVIDFTATRTSGRFLRTYGAGVITPIHTSFHYQTFETPYLHELVGGDRNMEQHNLVVTPDGKSWDEVTRDTSYIGKGSLNVKYNDDYTSQSHIIFHYFRGISQSCPQQLYNKDWAISRDRLIALRDGEYNFSWFIGSSSTGTDSFGRLSLNDAIVYISELHGGSSRRSFLAGNHNMHIKRGDYVRLPDFYKIEGSAVYNSFCITRL